MKVLSTKEQERVQYLPPITFVYAVSSKGLVCASDREGSYIEEWNEVDLSDL
ncbi:MAG: hypothetical protein IJQ93_11470 [Bacteroidales bacterium]|nr:hypothetical protein [Bacteroidales bacterium]